jgi:hypothetical protein
MARFPAISKGVRDGLGWVLAIAAGVAIANNWLPIPLRIALGALNLICILVLLAGLLMSATTWVRSRRK